MLSGNSTISESLGGQNVTLDLNSQLEQLGIPTSTSPFDFDALGRIYLSNPNPNTNTKPNPPPNPNPHRNPTPNPTPNQAGYTSSSP